MILRTVTGLRPSRMRQAMTPQKPKMAAATDMAGVMCGTGSSLNDLEARRRRSAPRGVFVVYESTVRKPTLACCEQPI